MRFLSCFRCVDLLTAATVLLLAVSLLSGCGKEGETAKTQSGQRMNPEHLVTVYTAELSAVASKHERPGSLRFRKLVRIYSQEEGRITELKVFEGDEVEADQLLVGLEDDLLRAELDKVRATKEQKRLDVERLEGLRAKRVASEDEQAQARTLLLVAEAEERLLETRLAFTRIHAPFAGVISERKVEPGDFVTKNTHLLTLADPSSLVAEVYASELLLPHLTVGNQVNLRIDALGAETFSGKILRIHPALDQTTRQGVIEVTMDPVPEEARAGQFVRAKLATATVERLLIPFRALRRDRGGELLWLVDNEGKALRRDVRSGLRIADRIEILDGLDSGERVITRGFLGLTEGKPVKVVHATE